MNFQSEYTRESYTITPMRDAFLDGHHCNRGRPYFCYDNYFVHFMNSSYFVFSMDSSPDVYVVRPSFRRPEFYCQHWKDDCMYLNI